MLAIKLKTVLAGLLVMLGRGTATLCRGALAQEKRAAQPPQDEWDMAHL
jgi:hypothetical protein